jgi:hypothetical protein
MKKILLKKFTLRFYDTEKDKEILKWMEETAEKGKYKYSDLIKLILKSAITKKCPSFSKGTEIQKFIYEVNKIGNNLNQIAKKVNFMRKLDNQVLDELSKIRQELQKLNENIKQPKATKKENNTGVKNAS